MIYISPNTRTVYIINENSPLIPGLISNGYIVDPRPDIMASHIYLKRDTIILDVKTNEEYCNSLTQKYNSFFCFNCHCLLGEYVICKESRNLYCNICSDKYCI